MGNTILLTDEFQKIVASYQYDTYGNLLSKKEKQIKNNYLFSTKQYLPITDLYYFGTRYL
jgi:hypothetical protein